MSKHNGYKLPASGQAREQLREKGQFWTPDWVAEAMVAYVLAGESGSVFDPAVGAGAFFRAAKTIAREKGMEVTLSGMDIDPTTLDQAIAQGLNTDDLTQVRMGDFIFQPPTEKLPAIVANPPYIRHHRLSAEIKEQLKRLSLHTTGTVLDGRAGLHIYFLLRALTLLQENGRLAFIMPADTCEGKFAPTLWRWLATQYALDAVIAFTPDASPFPNVDTNPLIFFIRNTLPAEKFLWARCSVPQSDVLKQWVYSGLRTTPAHGLTVIERTLMEGLSIGLSRPAVNGITSKYLLGDFARIMRGVATGANEFFFMTAEQVKQTGIPDCYFTRAIGRTRDVPTAEITQVTLDRLEEKGRPTYLLALNGEAFESYPHNLQEYLRQGETLGLPQKPLISQRKPWYKTESRPVPPLLFSYLGRRNSRFILNSSGIIPLTGFLCVYPYREDKQYLDQLWQILNHLDTVANLVLIGKSYGDGAVKVEPRALEKLPLPEKVVEQSGIQKQTQLRLFEEQVSYQT